MRNIQIDLFKGILVILMVTSHVIQFLHVDVSSLNVFTTYVDLTTFSGFLFAYGYASDRAYFSKDFNDVRSKMIKAVFKLLIAFYISGFAFYFLVLKGLNSNVDPINILLLNNIPMYSEFLASFVILIFTSIILFPVLKKLNPLTIKILVLISFIMCFFPYAIVKSELIGLFIGSMSYFSFPVVQYFPYFIAGIYTSNNELKSNYKIWGLTLFAFALYVIHYILHDKVPPRFPPSLLWITGSSIFIYAYYILSKAMCNHKLAYYIIQVGQKSLLYLLMSNLVLFSLFLKYQGTLNLFECIIVTILMIVGIEYLASISGRKHV